TSTSRRDRTPTWSFVRNPAASGALDRRVFRPGFDEYRDVGIGVLPQRQEPLIGRLRSHWVAVERGAARHAEVREQVIRSEVCSLVLNDLLEFSCGFRALAPTQIGHTTQVDDLSLATIVGHSRFERLDCLVGSIARQLNRGTNRW